MINLLKKDIRACFKTDFKMIIKLLVGIVVFSTILMPFATVAIPLFLSYIFIIKSTITITSNISVKISSPFLFNYN